jgi:hypothetical protein
METAIVLDVARDPHSRRVNQIEITLNQFIECVLGALRYKCAQQLCIGHTVHYLLLPG